MTKREILYTLTGELTNLVALLQLDAECPWVAKFEHDCATANELLRNGFSDDELVQLAISIKFVYQGMGSFNDYSPGIFNTATGRYDAIPGTENCEEVSKRVFDLSTKLFEKAGLSEPQQSGSQQSGSGSQ